MRKKKKKLKLTLISRIMSTPRGDHFASFYRLIASKQFAHKNIYKNFNHLKLLAILTTCAIRCGVLAQYSTWNKKKNL